MKKIDSLSIMFPLYKDSQTVEKMIIKSLKIGKIITNNYEIIIVDDGCPELSGVLAKKFAKKNKKIKVIFHKKNLGYGSALKTGFKNCKKKWIFQTDGDAEYDVKDLKKLAKFTSNSDLIITYRLKKKYNTNRIIISWIYNFILRTIFLTNFKDISTGSRLLNKRLFKKIKLSSNSPFVGAELAIKSKYNGFKVSEVGIHTYPRTFGSGSSVTLKNILLTILDMIRMFLKFKYK